MVLGFMARRTAAQDTHEHRGFWIGFGVGGGINMSEGLDGERLGGGTGYLRLGGTVSQHVLLGFDGIFWGRDQDNQTIARGNGTFSMLYYPSARGGGFLKSGLGWANVSRTETSGNTTSTTTKGGFGLTLGAGWDVRLGHNIYLTPNLDFLLQTFKSETDPVLGDIPGTNTLLLFTLGLTWH
jgi:hypothetical protein